MSKQKSQIVSQIAHDGPTLEGGGDMRKSSLRSPAAGSAGAATTTIDEETQLALADLHTVAQSIWWVTNQKALPTDAAARNERWQDDYPVWIKTAREVLRHLKNNGLIVSR